MYQIKKRMPKMRWTTLLIILLIITTIAIQFFAAWKLYIKLKNQLKYKNVSNSDYKSKKFQEDVEVLNVTTLRFHSYMRDFNKSYNKEEYNIRFENFKASLKDIDRLNKLENNTVFGLTKFSDMSKEEFAARMLNVNVSQCWPSNRNCTDDAMQTEPLSNKKYGYHIPSFFDWRKENVVKPVLDQKRCKGCWAFSIVGVLESMSAIQLNDHSRRSIEELLDCSAVNNGCNNGNVYLAMNYICDNKLQFVTEEEYPLTLSMDQTCKLPNSGYKGRRVKRYVHICKIDEDVMVDLIANHGPLIAAVDASNWLNYIGGVITRACTRGISNHVVQIVGYEGYGELDEKTPIPYYIVRNSFGEDWGDQGYVKIAMKHGDISDVCGIAEQVTSLDALE